MKFNKLALAAAVAAAPATGMAMEPMQDSEMSGVTGQDGINIDLATQMDTDLYVHDTDGLNGIDANGDGTAESGGYTESGAIVISNFGLTEEGGGADANIGISVDSGNTTAGGDTLLNVGITLGTDGNNVDVDLGELSVADSNRTDASADDADWGLNGAQSDNIMDMGTLTISANTTINVQLGDAEPQGHMIALNTSIGGGLSLADFAINDLDGTGDSNPGAIGAGNLAIVDNGGTNLNLDIGIDAVDGSGPETNAGLQITLNEFGHSTDGADIQIVDQYLGSSSSVVGDVEVVGLDLNGTTVTVSGR